MLRRFINFNGTETVTAADISASSITPPVQSVPTPWPRHGRVLGEGPLSSISDLRDLRVARLDTSIENVANVTNIQQDVVVTANVVTTNVDSGTVSNMSQSLIESLNESVVSTPNVVEALNASVVTAPSILSNNILRRFFRSSFSFFNRSDTNITQEVVLRPNTSPEVSLDSSRSSLLLDRAIPIEERYLDPIFPSHWDGRTRDNLLVLRDVYIQNPRVYRNPTPIYNAPEVYQQYLTAYPNTEQIFNNFSRLLIEYFREVFAGVDNSYTLWREWLLTLESPLRDSLLPEMSSYFQDNLGLFSSGFLLSILMAIIRNPAYNNILHDLRTLLENSNIVPFFAWLSRYVYMIIFNTRNFRLDVSNLLEGRLILQWGNLRVFMRNFGNVTNSAVRLRSLIEEQREYRRNSRRAIRELTERVTAEQAASAPTPPLNRSFFSTIINWLSSFNNLFLVSRTGLVIVTVGGIIYLFRSAGRPLIINPSEATPVTFVNPLPMPVQMPSPAPIEGVDRSSNSPGLKTIWDLLYAIWTSYNK